MPLALASESCYRYLHMSDGMETAAHKSKRQRSPSYPGIGLEAALDRAKALYQEEGRNAAPTDAILQHWGYSAKSGPGLVTLAALKRFGLLTTEGAGKARLSKLARSIILDERDDSPERDTAIKKAALMPGIHRELWDKYQGQLPSNATLRHFLRLEKGFTDGAADELIRQFRDTVSFAQLSESDELSDEFQDDGQGESSADDGVTGATATRESQRRRQDSRTDTPVAIHFPVVGGATVTLNTTAPLTEAAWDQMMVVLGAMKAGVVAPDEKDREESEE